MLRPMLVNCDGRCPPVSSDAAMGLLHALLALLLLLLLASVSRQLSRWWMQPASQPTRRARAPNMYLHLQQLQLVGSLLLPRRRSSRPARRVPFRQKSPWRLAALVHCRC